jgi:hypothetical protein
MGFIINPYQVQPGVPAFTGILDTYTGAAVAYSLRRLATAYTGPLIRVRRSSDNTEQDIGYTSGNVLDESALTSFVGANNGFVTTWYDQSGNGKNLTQSTAINQPKIVNSGSIYFVNSKPSIYNNTTTARLIENTINLSQPITTFTVLKPDNKGFNIYMDAYNTSNRFYIARGFSLNSFSASTDLNFDTFNTNQVILTVLANSTTSKTYVNNTLSNTGSAGTNGLNGISLFDIRGATPVIGGYDYDGYAQELIIYPSNNDSNSNNIQSNINTFYSIY